jgi:hypothetical protein
MGIEPQSIRMLAKDPRNSPDEFLIARALVEQGLC